MGQDSSRTSLNAEAERRRGLDPEPPANERQADAKPEADALPGASTAEAIDRATAALGHDDGGSR